MSMSQAQFAQFSGFSTTSIAEYCSEGMPHEAVGKGKGRRIMIDSALAVPWMIERARRQVESLDGETRRLRAAQADKAEMEAAQMRRELLPAEDVQIAVQELVVICISGV